MSQVFPAPTTFSHAAEAFVGAHAAPSAWADGALRRSTGRPSVRSAPGASMLGQTPSGTSRCSARRPEYKRVRISALCQFRGRRSRTSMSIFRRALANCDDMSTRLRSRADNGI